MPEGEQVMNLNGCTIERVPTLKCRRVSPYARQVRNPHGRIVLLVNVSGRLSHVSAEERCLQFALRFGGAK